MSAMDTRALDVNAFANHMRRKRGEVVPEMAPKVTKTGAARTAVRQFGEKIAKHLGEDSALDSDRIALSIHKAVTGMSDKQLSALGIQVVASGRFLFTEELRLSVGSRQVVLPIGHRSE